MDAAMESGSANQFFFFFSNCYNNYNDYHVQCQERRFSIVSSGGMCMSVCHRLL